MKTTTPYPCEMAYNCPYCDHTQGYSYDIDEDDYKEIHSCDYCKKEFKLEKEVIK